jgi:hypothetical protein
MLTYGAQGNCPTTPLPHPTCYEAQGLSPTPSLASSHHVITESLMEMEGVGCKHTGHTHTHFIVHDRC